MRKILTCFAQTHPKVPSSQCQNLTSLVADVLLRSRAGEIRDMLEIKMKNGEGFSECSAAESQEYSAGGKAVIVLHDLTTGPEEETSRLGTRVSELTAEIGSLRNENQRLKAELREIKLVLSKIQIDELRKFEKVNSWLRSFKKMI